MSLGLSVFRLEDHWGNCANPSGSELTRIMARLLDRHAGNRRHPPRRVYSYTSVPNTSIDPNALTLLFFDCQGHFESWNSDGPSALMDAPPRSVAGEIAETVCVNQSIPGPAQSNTMQPFTSANGRFSVLFHAIPQQFPQPIHLKNGKTGTVYVFYARADNNKTGDYVTYTDYSPDDIASASPQVLLQRAEKGFLARKTLLSEQVIDLDGVPGRALHRHRFRWKLLHRARIPGRNSHLPGACAYHEEQFPKRPGQRPVPELVHHLG